LDTYPLCCTVAGQGAGVNAATAVRDDVPFNQVSMSGVQKALRALREQGVRIE
jgi:hypothetical protein